MAVGNVYRLVRTVQIDGQTCVNVLHFLQSEEVGSDPEAALIAAWESIGHPTFRPEDFYQACQRGFSTYVYQSLSAQRITPDEGELVTEAFQTVKSSALDTGLPTFAQVKFGIQTDLNSRSGRGGFYMSGIAEQETNGNAVDGALITKMGSFLGSLREVFGAGGANYSGFDLGVWSRLLDLYHLGTVFTGATTLGTMVSRRVGHGV